MGAPAHCYPERSTGDDMDGKHSRLVRWLMWKSSARRAVITENTVGSDEPHIPLGSQLDVAIFLRNLDTEYRETSEKDLMKRFKRIIGPL